jgi:hypothetical protein
MRHRNKPGEPRSKPRPAPQMPALSGLLGMPVREMAKGRDTLAEFGGEGGSNRFEGRVERPAAPLPRHADETEWRKRGGRK